MDKKSSLDYFAEQKLASIEQRGLRRVLDTTFRGLAGAASKREKRLISFCCNDYLGLSQHPKVRKAATDAIKFTVTKEENAQPKAMSVKETDKNQQAIQCSLDDPEGCEMCGS